MRIEPWKIGDAFIIVPVAYPHGGWFEQVEVKLPHIAKKAHKYSSNKGWNNYQHKKFWCDVYYSWLEKKDQSN